MDGTRPSVFPQDLYSGLGTALAPIVVDVRRPADFAKADRLVVPAFHHAPDEVERWRKDLSRGRPVVVYCARGHEVSQGVTASLRAAGVQAVYLEGGIAGWTEKGLPTRRNIGVTTKDRPHCLPVAGQPLHRAGMRRFARNFIWPIS